MVQQIRPDELKRRLDAGEPVYLVDVRNYDEHAYCRLPDSLLVPLPELPARVEEVQPPEDALVVVYCHHGVRSLSGAAILQGAGHENVASLTGGIDAWSLTIDPAVPRY
jgi:rhodanese-related sulfurtransferase